MHINDLLKDCDKEPVSFIGSVQSFSAVVATDSNYVITHASANIDQFIEVSAESLLDTNVRSMLETHKNLKVREVVSLTGKLYEFEKNDVGDNNFATTLLIEQLNRLDACNQLQELLDCLADVLKKCTQLHRVMVYKFHEDFHGEVVAETVSPGMEPFLGLHYPASDIPQPARAQFLTNWVRMIPDVEARTYALKSHSGVQLDLTNSIARAVSPIHLQYLRNMGVRASLTLSIKINGELWGLIACHHTEPRFLTVWQREVCEVITRHAAARIEQVEREQEKGHLENQQKLRESLMLVSKGPEDIAALLEKRVSSLLQLLDASGVSVGLSSNGVWVSAGRVPEERELARIAVWIDEVRGDKAIFHTDQLSAHFPGGLTDAAMMCGLLAISIPRTTGTYILWFRPEFIQTVRWGGNPTQKALSESGKLTPRHSFAEWSETVRGKSKPWRAWEVSAALELRNAFVSLDLTRQFAKEHKARAEAEEARAEAERAVRAREELISVVSHDLKTPLNTIVINTHLLERTAHDERQVRTLGQVIARSANNMASLIEDLLNVARIESGHLWLEYTSRSIADAIFEVFDILLPLAEQKNIALHTQVELHRPVPYDYGRLLQVLSNLLGNAIKFTPEGGAVRISAEDEGEFVRISVTDTGPGIDPLSLPHVFDRFWQASQSKKYGSGLGLAIAKGIVEAHRGKIWVESDVGKGSSFFVRLPFVQN